MAMSARFRGPPKCGLGETRPSPHEAVPRLRACPTAAARSVELEYMLTKGGTMKEVGRRCQRCQYG